MHSLLRHVRRAALADADGLSDGQLLGGEDAAFEVLLRRHGPMVFGVCRRVLRDVHLAEDAFQATFLVLVRKAGTVRSQASLGSWLYKVAYRTAMKARAMHLKRRCNHARVPEAVPSDIAAEVARQELLERFDAVLNALPEKYRAPVVLCELEGKSRKQAAAWLGVPEGTLSWRLAQARKLLAQRLKPYAGGLACLGLADLSSASTPVPLLLSTANAARRLAAGRALAGAVSTNVLILTEGVIRAMFLSKLKLGGVIVLGMLIGGAGLTYGVGAEPKKAASSAALDEIEALRLEMEALRKSLQATRKRVETLESQVQSLTRPAAAGPEKPLTPDHVFGPRPGGMGGGNAMWGQPMMPGGPGLDQPGAVGKMPGGVGQPGMPDKGVGMPRMPGTGAAAPAATPDMPKFEGKRDPIFQAEDALKRLRDHPGDKEAADILEKALKELKGRERKGQGY